MSPDADGAATEGRTALDLQRDRAPAIRPPGAAETPPGPPPPPARPWLVLGLAVYNAALGVALCWLIVSLLLHWDLAAAPGADAAWAAKVEATLRFLGFTAMGSALGAIIHNLIGLHVHYAVMGDFRARFSGSYLFGPVAAAILGLAMFAILQGGLMALGGDVTTPEDSLRAALFYIAIGILTGLAWDAVILRFDAVARQVFGGDGSSLVKRAVGNAQRGPDAG
ncbi:MAG: hypothetical protein AB7K86_07320 [Rhodospirillales bacterium]